jgi:type II secretory pathway pseudopilin PulG
MSIPTSIPIPRRGATRATRPGGAGFTLTELLIVIGLIVLIIALAVPAFNALTGGRSIDAATNTLSAMLGRVRMEAIGLQEPRGLLFYRDPATQRVGARMVRFSGTSPTGIPGVELVEDRDPMLLPVGVGLQMVDDAALSGTGATAVAADDRYIGFNKTIGATGARAFNFGVGGIILFDQNGRLVSRQYGFHVRQQDPASKQPRIIPSPMARFLYGETNAPTTRDMVIANRVSANNVRSQFGFVLFDQEAFRNQFGTDTDPYGDEDPQMQGSGGQITPGSPEGKEEAWLDQNATPILINRYNGTLIRGE